MALIVTVYATAGMGAEELCDTYPPLTLAQVYSALAYYHDHKDEMDRRIAEGDRVEQEVRAKHDSSPKLRERLEAQGPLS